MSAKDRVGIHFTTKYEAAPTARVRVPSRLNLIGEHTDYNDGFVLPFAIDREMWIALRPRDDQTVHIRSESFVEEVIFDLTKIKKGSGWGEYVKGVAAALTATGRELRGFDAFLASDIPMGAGMSSSAAVCIGSAVALAVASDFYLEASELAVLSQRAENDWVGVESGIMDPLVMAGAHHGFAQLIDCRDFTSQDIAVPLDTVAAVLRHRNATWSCVFCLQHPENGMQRGCRLLRGFLAPGSGRIDTGIRWTGPGRCHVSTCPARRTGKRSNPSRRRCPSSRRCINSGAVDEREPWVAA